MSQMPPKPYHCRRKGRLFVVIIELLFVLTIFENIKSLYCVFNDLQELKSVFARGNAAKNFLGNSYILGVFLSNISIFWLFHLKND